MQITIEKMVYGGAGLARSDQGVIFVPRTAPGDVVEIEVVGRKKDYATGRVVRLITPSADRQEPFCPNYETAGCCHWQHIRYDRQLDFKEAILRESLTRLGHIAFDEPIRRISGPDRGYRLRANFHVQAGKLGFIRENTNAVVPIRECSALTPELNAFIPAANTVIGGDNFTALTEVQVVAGPAIAATFSFPGEQMQRPWEKMRDALFEIPGLAALTFMAGTRRLHYEKHPPPIEAGGNTFGLNSDAFFQANRFLLGPFIDEVLLQAGKSPSDVLDLFCGSGFFSIPVAKVSRQLIGVDSSRGAVKQAGENAKLNGVWNTEFVPGDIGAVLATAEMHPGLVILNPPRVGAGGKVATQIAVLKAPRIVYVSCNPTTFAREAAIFVKNGYQLKRVTMIDQFPHTYHIELVAQFGLE